MNKKSVMIDNNGSQRRKKIHQQGLGVFMLLLCSSGSYAYDEDGGSYSYHPAPKYNTVFKCTDSKGAVTMSSFECPNHTKMAGREDIKVRKHAALYNEMSQQDWRNSQYERPDYGSSYRRYAVNNRPNASAINASYKEAARQAEWDGWKNKDHSVTDAKLAALESQRKAAATGYGYPR